MGRSRKTPKKSKRSPWRSPRVIAGTVGVAVIYVASAIVVLVSDLSAGLKVLLILIGTLIVGGLGLGFWTLISQKGRAKGRTKKATVHVVDKQREEKRGYVTYGGWDDGGWDDGGWDDGGGTGYEARASTFFYFVNLKGRGEVEVSRKVYFELEVGYSYRVKLNAKGEVIAVLGQEGLGGDV